MVVPPGFAKIPLRQDGRPILSGAQSGEAGTTKPSGAQTSSSSLNQPNRTSQLPSRPAPAPPAPPATTSRNSDEVDDDLLAALENEADDIDDDGGAAHDPELEKINRQINSLMPSIKKVVPPKHNLDDDDEEADDDFMAKMEKLIANDDVKSRGAAKAAGKTDGVAKPQQLPPVINPPKIAPAKPAPSYKPMNKDLAVLIERQKLFKEAALQAKKEGNTNVALVYLRHSKVCS